MFNTFFLGGKLLLGGLILLHPSGYRPAKKVGKHWDTSRAGPRRFCTLCKFQYLRSRYMSR